VSFTTTVRAAARVLGAGLVCDITRSAGVCYARGERHRKFAFWLRIGTTTNLQLAYSTAPHRFETARTSTASSARHTIAQ
jgi:hypothetical protein